MMGKNQLLHAKKATLVLERRARLHSTKGAGPIDFQIYKNTPRVFSSVCASIHEYMSEHV